MAGILFFLSALGSYYPEFLFFEHGVPSYSLLVAFNFYRVLGGVGVGLASAICPMYIAEIAPSNIRGTLVSWNQFAIIFGQLVVYFVNFLILGSHANPVIDLVNGVNQIMNPEAAAWTTETGWRLMFVSEAVPAGLFALLVLLVPERRVTLPCAAEMKGSECIEPNQRFVTSQSNFGRDKSHYRRKDGKTIYVRLDGYLHRHHVERIPTGCRYQCRTVFCPAYIRYNGDG